MRSDRSEDNEMTDEEALARVKDWDTFDPRAIHHLMRLCEIRMRDPDGSWDHLDSNVPDWTEPCYPGLRRVVDRLAESRLWLAEHMKTEDEEKRRRAAWEEAARQNCDCK